LVSGLLFASLALAAGSAEKGKTAYVKHGCCSARLHGAGRRDRAKLAPNPIRPHLIYKMPHNLLIEITNLKFINFKPKFSTEKQKLMKIRRKKSTIQEKQSEELIIKLT